MESLKPEGPEWIFSKLCKITDHSSTYGFQKNYHNKKRKKTLYDRNKFKQCAITNQVLQKAVMGKLQVNYTKRIQEINNHRTVNKKRGKL